MALTRVKVQRPITTSEEAPDILLYSEDRSFFTTMPLDEEVLNLFFPNNELKTYWDIAIDDGGFSPVRQLKEQTW